MMERLAAVAALMQRRPALAAIAFGLIGACAYPPLHLWPLGLAALAGFVWLVYAAPTKRAALWIGWCFGWAHLTLANNWIATAFTHQAKMPEFLGWLAVPLLCIYLAWYPALAALAAHVLAKKRPLWAFGLVLAGAWIVTEWLRGWVFTGYPWPPVGLMLLGGWDTPGLASGCCRCMGTYALSGLDACWRRLAAGHAHARRWLSCGRSRAGADGADVGATSIAVTSPPNRRSNTPSSSPISRNPKSTTGRSSTSNSSASPASPPRRANNRGWCCGRKARCRTISRTATLTATISR